MTEIHYKSVTVNRDIPIEPKVMLTITESTAQELKSLLERTSGSVRLNDLYNALAKAGVQGCIPYSQIIQGKAIIIDPQRL